jgi:sugar lactone lactonase YvrE
MYDLSPRPGHFRIIVRTLALVFGLGVAQHLSAQGVIYITESQGTGSVVAYNLSNSQLYMPGSALSTTNFSSFFFDSISTDSSGNVYLAYTQNGSVNLQKFNNAGALVTGFGTGGTAVLPGNVIVTSSAVNPSGTQILLPFNANTNQVGSYSTSTGAATGGFTPIVLVNPQAVTFNPSGTFFYATVSSGSLGGSTITQYATTGGTGTAITYASGGYFGNGFDNAKGLLFQTDSSFLVASSTQGALERYTLSGTVATLDASFGTNGAVTVSGLNGGIAADGSGNLYVSTSSSIVEISANGTILNSSFITGLTNGPTRIAIGIAAIPEPDTVALLALGLVSVGLAGFRRRRR